MELDEIISPEMREAVRRSLAMNDALSEVCCVYTCVCMCLYVYMCILVCVCACECVCVIISVLICM